MPKPKPEDPREESGLPGPYQVAQASPGTEGVPRGLTLVTLNLPPGANTETQVLPHPSRAQVLSIPLCLPPPTGLRHWKEPALPAALGLQDRAWSSQHEAFFCHWDKPVYP